MWLFNKKSELTLVEQAFVDTFEKRFVLNPDTDKLMSTRMLSQTVIKNTRAFQDDSGQLRYAQCFKRKNQDLLMGDGGPFVQSPTMKVAIAWNDDPSNDIRTGVMFFYDDDAGWFSNSQSAFKTNRELIGLNRWGKFVLDAEEASKPYIGKVVVQGMSNVRVNARKGEQWVDILDFTPLERKVDLNKLKKEFIKIKKSEGSVKL